MNDTNNALAQRALFLVGRGLLGLYFIIPGNTKIPGWSGTVEYMAAHGVPLIPVLLVITIILQIGGGLCLAIGFRARLMAFVLAGLTLVINIFMPDFWNVEEAVQGAHETQNFIKNLAVMGSTMGPRSAYPLILERLAAGTYKPVLNRTMPMSQVADAHRVLEDRGVVGKVVLIPGQ